MVVKITRTTSGGRGAGPLAVTVRVGIFFDGTGNNRANSRIGSACRAAGYPQGKHSRECAGRHDDPLSSYYSEVSNIAHLAELYRHVPAVDDRALSHSVYWPIYISGVGTVSRGRDCLLRGQGFGRGATGVLAKVDAALQKLQTRLRQFAELNPGCVIDRLELDVFGFSRGAASARHLVNEVLKQDKGDLAPLLFNRKVPLSAGFAWSANSVQVKVVGLFDTVAAVGSFRDLGSVSDFANRRVNLYLPPGCAQQVLHLVARDESRRNFALNSVLPEWAKEIVLPGAHSDIGGGYPVSMQEKVRLTRPRHALIAQHMPSQASSAWAQAEADLLTLDAAQWLDPHDPHARLRVECCGDGEDVQNGLGLKSVMAAVCLQRQVSGHLSRISLRVMHALAIDEGVPLAPIPDAEPFVLDAELHEIAHRIVASARGDHCPLTEQQELRLRQRYIHCSAHWNPLEGLPASLGRLLFVHAPQPGGRVRHPNVGQPGYPQ